MRLAKLSGIAGTVYIHPDAVLSITPAKGGTSSWVTVRSTGEAGQSLLICASPEAIHGALEAADAD